MPRTRTAHGVPPASESVGVASSHAAKSTAASSAAAEETEPNETEPPAFAPPPPEPAENADRVPGGARVARYAWSAAPAPCSAPEGYPAIPRASGDPEDGPSPPPLVEPSNASSDPPKSRPTSGPHRHVVVAGSVDRSVDPSIAVPHPSLALSCLRTSTSRNRRHEVSSLSLASGACGPTLDAVMSPNARERPPRASDRAP